MRAVLYARYSTPMQRVASVEDQLRLLRQRAASEGWTIHAEHADRAISGSVRQRPGFNACIAALESGAATILLAESLDRISRDQEDLAALLKRTRFHSARIVTLSEGEIGSIHIGMSGTMSAIMLEQTAEKVRRGQIGRVEAGRIPGGLSYGYRKRIALDARGEPERGLREIDQGEALVIRRIFKLFIEGHSPRAIALMLNAEQVPSPSGKLWRANTIMGHRQRRNGILHNELYRGRILYNRQNFRKDPDSRKRVSRPNGEEAMISAEVPDLAIIDPETWEMAQARMDAAGERKPHQQRRPKRLLSGLLVCGLCNGSFIAAAPGYWGCSNHRQTGTCSCSANLRDDEVQARIWAALETNLLDPEVIGAYLDERRKLVAQLRRERIAARAATDRRRAELHREQARIADAVVAGIPPETLREKAQTIADELAALNGENDEAQWTAIEAAEAHPAVADHYRRQIKRLKALTDTDETIRRPARAMLETLIEKIEVTPRAQRKGFDLTIHGDLAAMLQPLPDPSSMTMVVAGAGFGRCHRIRLAA